MKILITGVSGFIGSRLLKAVCARYGVKNVLALSSKVQSTCDYVLYNTDYAVATDDIDKLAQIELVIHAGAFTPKNRFDANEVKGCNSNIQFINDLLKLPFPALKKFIYLSTLDVYGEAELISETSELGPASLYGLSKLYCEKMLSSYCDGNNLQCQVLRIGHVYGPGEEKYEKFLPNSIKRIIKEEPIELWGDGSELRSFIYINDVIDACVAAIDLSETVGVINVVGGQAISIVDLVNKLDEITDEKVVVDIKPYSGVKRDLLFDNSKMRKYLITNEISLDEGLKEEVAYFRALN